LNKTYETSHINKLTQSGMIIYGDFPHWETFEITSPDGCSNLADCLELIDLIELL